MDEGDPFELEPWQRDLIITVTGVVGTLVGTVIARMTSRWITEEVAQVIGGE